MDRNIALRVEGISKEYTIGTREQYQTLRDTLSGLVNPSSWMRKGNGSKISILALRDVSFEVRKGHVLGIIGKNAAGKTTLFKIISRITEPTSGTVTLRGRVSVLIEVGTGFHPELTGRENIYVSGSILGMKRREINRQFREIVEFAGVEKFLDTPVKRYSAGMWARLAFSVAAYLESEILLIDEVLAVGDINFQKRCFEKIDEISRKEGRTILIISHNMSAVEQLCNQCILLDAGRLIEDSFDVSGVIRKYLYNNVNGQTYPSVWTNPGNQFLNPYFVPSKLYIGDLEGNPLLTIPDNQSELWVYVEGEIKQAEQILAVGYSIYSEEGFLMYRSYHTDGGEENCPKIKNGKIKLKAQLPRELFNTGFYKIGLLVILSNKIWLFEPMANAPTVFLTISEAIRYSSNFLEKRPGLIAPKLKWYSLTN